VALERRRLLFLLTSEPSTVSKQVSATGGLAQFCASGVDRGNELADVAAGESIFRVLNRAQTSALAGADRVEIAVPAGGELANLAPPFDRRSSTVEVLGLEGEIERVNQCVTLPDVEVEIGKRRDVLDVGHV
jgi:hypothetical protein